MKNNNKKKTKYGIYGVLLLYLLQSVSVCVRVWLCGMCTISRLVIRWSKRISWVSFAVIFVHTWISTKSSWVSKMKKEKHHHHHHQHVDFHCITPFTFFALSLAVWKFGWIFFRLWDNLMTVIIGVQMCLTTFHPKGISSDVVCSKWFVCSHLLLKPYVTTIINMRYTLAYVHTLTIITRRAFTYIHTRARLFNLYE